MNSITGASFVKVFKDWLKKYACPVIIKSAYFVGSMIFLAIALSVIYLTTLLMAGYNDPLNSIVVDSHYPFATKEELKQKAKHHGTYALKVKKNQWKPIKENK
jgi:hypothetical protein